MEKDKCNCSQEFENDQEPKPSRRSFLGFMVTALNLAVVSALAIPAIRFVVSPLGRKSKEAWIDILSESELKVGETKEVGFVMKVYDGYQTVDRKYTVYLHKSEHGLKCFDPACTHLGCKIKFQDDQRRYFCPCHGGIFSENGAVVSGPPPTGLIEHPVKVANGRILVSRQV